MAFSLELDALDSNTKRKISTDLSIKPKKTQYDLNPVPNYVFATNQHDNIVYLPIGQWNNYLDEFPHKDKNYPHTNIKFTKQLYTIETDPKKRGRDQNIVAAEAIQQLKEKHTTFISCFTGYGKTSLATYLFSIFKLKTAVLCHINTVKEQWPDEIAKFTEGTCKVQIVKGKTPLDPNADVYIFGIRKASTMKREELLNIGMVIIDEAHICTVTAFTKSLLKFQPCYLIGLSATPDRSDELHKLLYAYFGQKEEFIYRHEVKNFTVIKYKTQYKPDISYIVVHGKVVIDWTTVITSLEENSHRQKELAQLAIDHPNEKIIILSKRLIQSNKIYDILENANESVEKLTANKKKWDQSKRILVASLQKGGVGLNDPNLTMLILGCDTKDVRQLEGRIRTTDNIVYHIVDDHPTLEKHWNICEKWYIKRGATIVSGGKVLQNVRILPKRYLSAK